MTIETIKIAIGALSNSKLLTDDQWQELAIFLESHPVMQEGKEEKLCPRCEDELAMRENPSLSQLTKAMKEHPEGGSCIVTSDNPLHAPLQYKWCILPRSKPSQECEHNYNYSCPKCK